MIITTQNKEMLVNMEFIKILNIHNDGIYAKEGKEYCILAFYGDGEDDCVRLGDYATKERCKEILQGNQKRIRQVFLQTGRSGNPQRKHRCSGRNLERAKML